VFLGVPIVTAGVVALLIQPDLVTLDRV